MAQLHTQMGASMIKWTKIVLWYIKVMFLFLVKGLKVLAKCCSNWIFDYYDLYCCVQYSNVEY